MSRIKEPARSPTATAAKNGKRSAVRSGRRSGTGAFVLGRRAFAKVSEVEGIQASKHLEADLQELADADEELRRETLLEKYGRS